MYHRHMLSVWSFLGITGLELEVGGGRGTSGIFEMQRRRARQRSPQSNAPRRILVINCDVSEGLIGYNNLMTEHLARVSLICKDKVYSIPITVRADDEYYTVFYFFDSTKGEKEFCDESNEFVAKESPARNPDTLTDDTDQGFWLVMRESDCYVLGYKAGTEGWKVFMSAKNELEFLKRLGGFAGSFKIRFTERYPVDDKNDVELWNKLLPPCNSEGLQVLLDNARKAIYQDIKMTFFQFVLLLAEALRFPAIRKLVERKLMMEPAGFTETLVNCVNGWQHASAEFQSSKSVAEINAALRPLGIRVRNKQITLLRRNIKKKGKVAALGGKDKFVHHPDKKDAFALKFKSSGAGKSK